MGMVLLPTMSSAYGEGDAGTIRKLLDMTPLWLSLICLFLDGIFIILSEDILAVLFKPAFAEATISLQMLIRGLCLSTMVVPSVSALSGTRFVKIPNAAGVIGLLVGLALWPFLIPRFGINGTAGGYIVGSILTSIIILHYAVKYYGLDLRRTYFANAACLLIFALASITKTLAPVHSNWVAVAVFTVLFMISFKKYICNICCKLAVYESD